ncbi:MAG TPA: hypothetical protein DCS29_00260 [Candidatus Magasanikbacteria bacterium]|nr:hypothetical protein [Candidatus Magasanikbacteria bacterium]
MNVRAFLVALPDVISGRAVIEAVAIVTTPSFDLWLRHRTRRHLAPLLDHSRVVGAGGRAPDDVAHGRDTQTDPDHRVHASLVSGGSTGLDPDDPVVDRFGVGVEVPEHPHLVHHGHLALDDPADQDGPTSGSPILSHRTRRVENPSDFHLEVFAHEYHVHRNHATCHLSPPVVMAVEATSERLMYREEFVNKKTTPSTTWSGFYYYSHHFAEDSSRRRTRIYKRCVLPCVPYRLLGFEGVHTRLQNRSLLRLVALLTLSAHPPRGGGVDLPAGARAEPSECAFHMTEGQRCPPAATDTGGQLAHMRVDLVPAGVGGHEPDLAVARVLGHRSSFEKPTIWRMNTDIKLANLYVFVNKKHSHTKRVLQ